MNGYLCMPRELNPTKVVHSLQDYEKLSICKSRQPSCHNKPPEGNSYKRDGRRNPQKIMYEYHILWV